MVLKLGDMQWKLHFHTVLLPDTAEKPNKELWDMETHCYVHTGPCIWTSTEPKYCINGRRGVARCSRKDQFVKKVGHRLALTKAIEKLPEATRAGIWQAYWTRVRRPKESPTKFRSRLARLEAQGAPSSIIRSQAEAPSAT